MAESLTAEELLAELEPLSHQQRVRRMVELGRASKRDAAAEALLDTLEARGFYERWLALHACFGSGDGERALRGVSDPSRTIRRLAVRLVAFAADDAQALAALRCATTSLLRPLLRLLARRGRRGPVDAFLAALAEAGDDRLEALLPFGSPVGMQRHVEIATRRAGAVEWRRLARWHADFAASALRARAEAATAADARLLWQARAALPELAERRPDAAAALAGTLSRHAPIAQLDLQSIVLRRPLEVADLVLASPDRAAVNFDRVADRLDLPRLLALFARGDGSLRDVARVLRQLPVETRAALYAANERGWRDAEGCVPASLAAELRRLQREKEGRRHLSLPALATRAERRLPYASFLPWEEARAALDPFIANPAPELRIAALSALVFAARFHRDRLPELLERLRARRNEQDPVRSAIVGGLADLPPGGWQAEHLDALGEILRDALDAADLSHGTASSAERLVVALLPFHPGWSVEWLATLVKARGQIAAHQLDDRLSDADTHRIAPELLPVLQSWETREREAQLVGVAHRLGRRLRLFEGLVEILERVLKETPNPWIAERALRLIVEHWPERAAMLIPALVARDPSWVTRQPVYTHLHRRRQDLLTPFLGQQSYSGRFSTGRTRFVLPLRSGFQRWTPTQQAIFAETLTGLTRDNARDTPALLMALSQLAALPAVPPTRLVQLATHHVPNTALRDAALRALGSLDAGQGVETLVFALEDDRARIAIYALRAALLEMPVDRALSLLRAAPLAKVTVAKEVVRLLGELPSEAAYRQLLALDGPDLHRDVRVALLRALWDHLERDETWPILERAATSPDAALATMAGRTPADRLSPDTERRLAAMLATLLAHPQPEVRVAIARQCAQLPATDRERALLSPLLAAMNSRLPDEGTAAAQAVIATYAGGDAPLVGAAVAAMLANRRAVQTLVRILVGSLRWNRGQLLPAAAAVVDALEADPLTASLRVELAAHALPWEDLAELLVRAAAAGELHADAVATAARAIEAAAARPDAAAIEPLELRLAATVDERLRRLAFAALATLSAPPRGWDDARLVRLRAYRADASALVAAAAQFTLPAEEDE